MKKNQRINSYANTTKEGGRYKFFKGLATGILLSASLVGGYELIKHYNSNNANTINYTETATTPDTQTSTNLTYEDLQIIIENLQNENDSLKEENQTLSSELEEAKQTIAELTEQIEKLNGSIDQLNNDVAELEKAINSLTEENSSLKEQVESLKKSLSDSINYYRELSDMYDKLKATSDAQAQEIENLSKQLTDAYNKISYFETKIVALYNGLTKSNSTSEEAIKDLESLLRLFGIEYSDQGASSYSSSSEYEPGE